MKHEAKFQTVFGHWVKENFKNNACFELKQTETSLPFNKVQPHQIAALMVARNDGLFFKIPDVGYQNPFDCFLLVHVDAYIVVKYPKFFCLIDVEDFIYERDILSNGRKSLTADRAKAIADLVVSL